MTNPRSLHYKLNASIGADLTVLGVLDKQRRNPVYIVWHHRKWCPMACKVFRSIERMRREADILALMSHPNTVRFLGVGSPAHLLMEFLEGPTLSRLIDIQRRERLSVSNAVRVAIHLGSALHHVHDQGFIHLDVKPTNVIVVRGRPVLYDFGIARAQCQERPPHTQGTDAYIAPEECLRQVVSPAADVFGLGVTLYEMLTGTLPFPDGTRRRPYPQIFQEPMPPREANPKLPVALEALVLSCLARDPASRPTLPDLLPGLHRHIRSGPSMWPAGFQPELTIGKKPRRAQSAPRRTAGRSETAK